MAQQRLKSSVKAACAQLGAFGISYSLQAAIITTTNKRALSRVLFCSSSILFQSVIRILLLSSSSSWTLFVFLLFFSFFHLHSQTPGLYPSSPPPPFTSRPFPCPFPPPSKVRSDLSGEKTNGGERTDCWMPVDLSKQQNCGRIENLNLH